ncbi:hypothetical protein FACUT_6729 [Fusarium acutatum]|uniref:Heterokaryon incompatibility domain-containing protein n=1 Tax=Fusarium acutatum TaxID=78861 RepID=A0A8H4NK51_9HYPO|nr:hypothetical protein FACUT_6729 [Fusarium acutatum]
MLSSTKTRSIAILNQFFSRSYFARLWIVQELLLARSIKIHCGEASIHVSNESIAQLYEQGVKVPSWVRYAGKVQLNAGRPHMDLKNLLVATSVCQVTDLRDKIFGLLGLVTDIQASDLSPDYDLMIREVYIGVAAYLMENYQSYDLIQLLTKNSSIAYSYGIPSWVPMWDRVALLHGSQDLCAHIQRIELDCRRLLARERGVKYVAIRTIDGWPHDGKSDCKGARIRCKAVHSGSGFLATNIETVICLKSDPVFDRFQSGSAGGLEGNEYTTSIYHVKGDIEVAIRTFRYLTFRSAHLIRVEGCASLFLADTTSDSLQYRLIAPCVAAIVCRTKEPSPVQSLQFEDLHRLSQFTPLTLEMVQFMAE